MIDPLPRVATWALAGGAIAAAVAAAQIELIEPYFYNGWMGAWIPQSLQAKPSPEIVLIAMDDHTSKTLEEPLPLTLVHHAQILEELARHYHPKAVGYTYPVGVQDESAPGFSRAAKRFVQAAQELENQGRPVVLGTQLLSGQEQIPVYPLSQLKTAPNVWTPHTALTHLAGRPSFSLDLAQLVGWAEPSRVPRGAWTEPATDTTYFRYRYTRDLAVDPTNRDFHEVRGPYRIVPFVDVLLRETPVELLREKVILIGTINHDDPTDFTATPFQQVAALTPNLSIQAAILDSVRVDSGVLRLPALLQCVITGMIAGVAIALVLHAPPVSGALFTIATLVGTLLAAAILFRFFGVWLRMTEPLLGLAIGYYLGIPYRLTHEHRARWDLERRHEMLRKVEDLKDHFLSLVTHDLKTPLARIQGLAERLTVGAAKTKPEQAAMVGGQILRATQELNQFVTQLLEVGRIDSQELKLQIASRDPNRVIEDVVVNAKEQAQDREVQIVTELDPLFPMPMDARLMSQVVQNLLDNAIKYSPARGEVLVRSREAGDHIEISVQDQGEGIPEDEQTYLFNRFYRSPSNERKGIAGTGLGLYLSRYFTEAHGGKLTVHSEPGRGSTFTLSIPIESPERKLS